MSVLIISIIGWVALVLGWIIFNLYNKNVKMEKMLVSQNEFVKNVLTLADGIDKTVQKIDATIWVSGDSELKALFSDVKAMQDAIHQFTKK